MSLSAFLLREVDRRAGRTPRDVKRFVKIAGPTLGAPRLGVGAMRCFPLSCAALVRLGAGLVLGAIAAPRRILDLGRV